MRLKNGLTFNISLHQGTECDITYTADTSQEDLWNGFLAGSNPYSGNDDPEMPDRNWQTTHFQFTTEHLDLTLLNEAPEESDWQETYEPAELGENVKPFVIVNPFEVGKLTLSRIMLRGRKLNG